MSPWDCWFQGKCGAVDTQSWWRLLVEWQVLEVCAPSGAFLLGLVQGVVLFPAPCLSLRQDPWLWTNSRGFVALLCLGSDAVSRQGW